MMFQSKTCPENWTKISTFIAGGGGGGILTPTAQDLCLYLEMKPLNRAKQKRLTTIISLS